LGSSTKTAWLSRANGLFGADPVLWIHDSSIDGYLSVFPAAPNFFNTTFTSESSSGCLYISYNLNLTGLIDSCLFERCRGTNTGSIWFVALPNTEPKTRNIVSRTIFRDNEAIGGGDVVRSSQASIDFEDCSFVNNSASGTLGSIVKVDKAAAINNCLFFNNTADVSVVYRSLQFSDDKHPFSVSSSRFLYNTGRLGAGVRITGQSEATISNTTFLYNTAVNPSLQIASALYCDAFNTSIVITDSLFKGNSARGNPYSSTVGHAPAVNNVFEFRNCTFDSNSALPGTIEGPSAGAIVVFFSATLTGCRFSNNSNGFIEGARDVYVESGKLFLSVDTTISGPPGIGAANGALVEFIPTATSSNVTVTSDFVSISNGGFICTNVACTFLNYRFDVVAVYLNFFPAVFHNARAGQLKIAGTSSCYAEFTGQTLFRDAIVQVMNCNVEGNATLTLGSVNPQFFNIIQFLDSIWTQKADLYIDYGTEFDARNTASKFILATGTSIEVTKGPLWFRAGFSFLADAASSFSWAPNSPRIDVLFRLQGVTQLLLPANTTLNIRTHAVSQGDAFPLALYETEADVVVAGPQLSETQFAVRDVLPNTVAITQTATDGLLSVARIATTLGKNCGDIGFAAAYCIAANGTTTAYVYEEALFRNVNFSLSAASYLFSAGVRFEGNSTVMIPWKRQFSLAAKSLMGVNSCPLYFQNSSVKFSVEYDARAVAQSLLTYVLFNPLPIDQIAACATDIVIEAGVFSYEFTHIVDPQPVCDMIRWEGSFLSIELDNCTFPFPPPTNDTPPIQGSSAPATLIPSESGTAMQTSSAGSIAGGVIGAILAIAIVAGIIAFLLLRKKKKTKRSPEPEDVFAPIPLDEMPRPEPQKEETPISTPRPAAIVDESLLRDATPIEDLTIAQELGRGSWGTVSLAVLKGEFVALKRVSAESSERIQTLAEEAKLMSTIKANRNLVKYLGICGDSTSFGILMVRDFYAHINFCVLTLVPMQEFCPRGSLLQYLRRSPSALPEYEVFKFAFGILEGMIALSTSKLTHRDLAARNVLLDEKLFAKVSDFGTARSMGIAEQKGASEDMLGPFKWQAPEVLASQANTDVSDVWSYGCTLLEIVTKKEPYAGYKGNVIELIKEIRNGSIDPLSHIEQVDKDAIASWPVWVVPILKSCFIIDPTSRPTFREIRFQMSPKTRLWQDVYDAEQDDIDSVLSSNYGSIPSGSPHSSAETMQKPLDKWQASSPTQKEVIAASSSAEGIQDVERLGKLGEGSYGAVYLGKFQGQYVAIKVLTISDQSVEEVRREAGIMSAISNHRNVIQLFGMVKDADRLSIVMELAPKGSLEDFIAASKKRAGEALLFKWALGIARGMAHLTQSKVIHRDLSARNVLLDSSLEPKIADFGLGRRVLDPSQETSTQTDVGPLRWFAPECFDLKYSEKTDVWAYGATLVEIHTGAVPFADKDVIGVFQAVKDEGKSPLDFVDASKIPAWLRSTMEKCFTQDPKDRPTFSELVSYVESQADSITEIREAEAAIQRRRNMRAGTLIAPSQDRISPK
jgi:serine/threonine protein kinase